MAFAGPQANPLVPAAKDKGPNGGELLVEANTSSNDPLPIDGSRRRRATPDASNAFSHQAFEPRGWSVYGA